MKQQADCLDRFGSWKIEKLGCNKVVIGIFYSGDGIIAHASRQVEKARMLGKLDHLQELQNFE